MDTPQSLVTLITRGYPKLAYYYTKKGNNEVLPASLHFLNFIIPDRNVQNVYPPTFESKQVKQTV